MRNAVTRMWRLFLPGLLALWLALGTPACAGSAQLASPSPLASATGAASASPAPSIALTATPGSSLASPTPDSPVRGTLRVRVRERVEGGANLPTPTPAPVPPPTLTPSVFRGQATVRVARAGSSTNVVAEGVASDSTWTTFEVPAGRYWVFLPRDQQTTLANQSYAPSNLPDGSIVDAWSEATVSANGSVDVTLVARYGLP